jgi:hypothetical protein
MIVLPQSIFRPQENRDHQVYYKISVAEWEFKEIRYNVGGHYNACYSGLLSALSDYFSQEQGPENKRVIFTTWLERENHHLLNDKLIRWYLSQCRKSNILPKNVDSNYVLSDPKLYKMRLDIGPKLSSQALYIHLCAFRYLREQPGLLPAIEYLCKDLKVDFRLAYYIAHFFIIRSGNGHTVSSWGISNSLIYGKGYDHNKITLQPAVAGAFVNALLNKGKFMTNGSVWSNESWSINNFELGNTESVTLEQFVNIPIKDFKKLGSSSLGVIYNYIQNLKIEAQKNA